MISRLVAALPLAVCLAAGAQQPLTPPLIAPFGDALWWVMAAPLPTRIGRSTEVITVPKGFVTDLASIPRFFWAAFPKNGPYMSAAILHDYLYWDQRCSREQADRIFEIEMKSFGVNDTSRTLIHSAVSDFGGSSWQANTAARTGGEIRYMPDDALARFLSQPLDASRTWPVVRGELPREAAARTDPNPELAATCTRAVQANTNP